MPCVHRKLAMKKHLIIPRPGTQITVEEEAEMASFDGGCEIDKKTTKTYKRQSHLDSKHTSANSLSLYEYSG